MWQHESAQMIRVAASNSHSHCHLFLPFYPKCGEGQIIVMESERAGGRAGALRVSGASVGWFAAAAAAADYTAGHLAR